MRKLFTLLVLGWLMLYLFNQPESQPIKASDTPAGLESELMATIKLTLARLVADEALGRADVQLRTVKFTPTREGVGEYTAVIAYDLLRPLTIQTGHALLRASCAGGLAKVKLTDQYGLSKTFSCQDLP